MEEESEDEDEDEDDEEGHMAKTKAEKGKGKAKARRSVDDEDDEEGRVKKEEVTTEWCQGISHTRFLYCLSTNWLSSCREPTRPIQQAVATAEIGC